MKLGVTLKVYDDPVPLKSEIAPPFTTRSPWSKPVTSIGFPNRSKSTRTEKGDFVAGESTTITG